MTEPKGSSSTTRRTFLKASTTVAAGGAVLSQLGVLPAVHAAGSDVLRVGVIGCGGRGRGAADNCAKSTSGVKIVALADTFRDQVDVALRELNNLGTERFDVPTDRQFVGLDAYKQLVASDLDMVILATPPGFRPIHLRAAVEAGKQIFTEKPVAVDGPGIRSVLETYEMAKQKNLAVVAGTQRRHQKCYLDSMKRIRDGQIGDLVAARCYWNQGGLWNKGRESSWSDVEWQIRNWLYFTWLSGDHICEQHVHNLDVINWAMRGHPTRATGMG
ncbi:MAG TPA: Gfo/Idh/MocA family oxidoreductase, partial [Isosphaeraceae bacterium]|nr:Gfo/Idh/MocA family oxidoreductase [Isosphaeraceae bacterium]